MTGRRRGALGLAARVARRPLDGITAFAGLVIVVLCALVARDGTVGPAELAVFHAVNGLPEALSPPMQGAQLLGVLAIGPVAAGISAVLGRWHLALACLLVTVGKLLAERTVWEVVQRSRPGTTIPDAIVRGDTPSAGQSFVSGHVVLVTGLAWVIAPYLRGSWRALPWAVVALVSFARVYLGAHAPLDVAGGFGLGLLVGAVANLVVGIPSEVAETPPVAIEDETRRSDRGGSR